MASVTRMRTIVGPVLPGAGVAAGGGGIFGVSAVGGIKPSRTGTVVPPETTVSGVGAAGVAVGSLREQPSPAQSKIRIIENRNSRLVFN